MKKIKTGLLLVLTAVLLFLILSCAKNNIGETVDYSEYSFTDTLWTRKAEHDIENIRFGSDGSYAYWCACGNSVNDSDLNEGYTYDDATNTITIKYIETTEETISKIIVEECSGKVLKLNFNGEIREFVKEKKLIK